VLGEAGLLSSWPGCPWGGASGFGRSKVKSAGTLDYCSIVVTASVRGRTSESFLLLKEVVYSCYCAGSLVLLFSRKRLLSLRSWFLL